VIRLSKLTWYLSIVLVCNLNVICVSMVKTGLDN
jgi:hypothetical protein